jgi:hypothetical protein
MQISVRQKFKHRNRLLTARDIMSDLGYFFYRTDVHDALVIVGGAEALPNRFIALAFTDAGILRQYSVEGSIGG